MARIEGNVIPFKREALLLPFEAPSSALWNTATLRVVGNAWKWAYHQCCHHDVRIEGRPAPVTCNRSALGAENMPIIDSNIRAR